jgi:hypothetical protein
VGVLAGIGSKSKPEQPGNEAGGRGGLVAVTDRPQNITFGEMRESGVRGVLIYCADFKCSHSIAVSADQWPDDVRLSDIEDRFVCKACGKRGADVRPDFAWDKAGAMTRGY